MVDDPTRAQVAVDAVDEEVRAWRRAHPEATLTEIEQAVDTRLRAVRAALLAEVAGDVALDEVRWPACGGPLVARGPRTRTLATHGDELFAPTRGYATCSACGTRLFPPR